MVPISLQISSWPVLGLQPLTLQSQALFSILESFLPLLSFAHEHTVEQMFRWPSHLNQTHFSPLFPSFDSVPSVPPSPSRLQTKADYHIHEAAGWQMKARAKERTKPTLYCAFIAYRSSFHLQLFSQSLRCSFLLSLSPYSFSRLSTACLYSCKKTDLCVCVCETLHILTLTKRLNTLYYIM